MAAPEDVILDLKSRLRRLNPIAKFRGFSEDEIAEGERPTGLRLPSLLRHFMQTMGDHAGGLLTGSDLVAPEQLVEFREEAKALLAESGSKSELPPSAVVFVFHQGYSFLYLEAQQTNSPVFEFVEGHPEPKQICNSLAEFFEEELRLMESRS